MPDSHSSRRISVDSLNYGSINFAFTILDFPVVSEDHNGVCVAISRIGIEEGCIDGR